MAGIAHPAKMLWLVTVALLLLAMAFTVSAAVVPQWSRISGPSGIQALVDGGYLTSMVSTDFDRWSTVYIGLWRWCLEYDDKASSVMCSNSVAAGIPSFGNEKCKGHFYAARHLNWISAVVIFLCMLVAALCFVKCSKWAPGAYWKAPKAPAMVAVFLSMLALGLGLACMVCWIVLAEHPCRGGSVSWDPYQGYSTSFIFQCTAIFLVLMAFLTACLGMAKINAVPQYSYAEAEPIQEVQVVQQQQVQVVYQDVPVPVY